MLLKKKYSIRLYRKNDDAIKKINYIAYTCLYAANIWNLPEIMFFYTFFHSPYTSFQYKLSDCNI